jgi:hypothetical protein
MQLSIPWTFTAVRVAKITGYGHFHPGNWSRGALSHQVQMSTWFPGLTWSAPLLEDQT